MSTHAYSLSSQEGDSILDYEDLDSLIGCIASGAGYRVALLVGSLLASGESDRAHNYLRQNYSVTLTVHDIEGTE